MKKVLFSCLGIAAMALAGQAQINVFGNNLVGIGSATSANSSLSVNSTGNSKHTLSLAPTNNQISLNLYAGPGSLSMSGNYTGIYSSAQFHNGLIISAVWGNAYCTTVNSDGRSRGVVGYAGNSEFNAGVQGTLLGTKNGAGVYGSSVDCYPIVNGQYAGFFYGNVKITGDLWAASGTITGSDAKLKKNIAVLDSTNYLYKLDAKKYNYKTRMELAADRKAVSVADTGSVAPLNEQEQALASKKHYGFLAQDVQKIYPELVYTASDGTMGIDYQGFIPIIIEQMKAMRKELDAKEARIKALETEVKKLKR